MQNVFDKIIIYNNNIIIFTPMAIYLFIQCNGFNVFLKFLYV